LGNTGEKDFVKAHTSLRHWRNWSRAGL